MRIALFILFILATAVSKAALIKVQPASTGVIGAAIRKATPGDTLLVEAGVYKEHDILVNKRLIIIGTGLPILDGENKYQLLVVSADSVMISGLQIQNTGRSSMTDMAGIRLQNVTYAIISKNKLINNTYGVYLQNSSNCVIADNVIAANAKDELNSGNGIHAWKSDNLVIKSNKVTGHRDGIYFEFVTDSKIVNNLSEKNIRYGLHFMFSHNDTYTGNRFSDNGSGVAVMYSKHVIMLNNSFYHNWGDASYGILLKDISDSRIEHNKFQKNTVGILMEGTSRTQVKQNEFHSNGWAMRVQASCNDNVFEQNNFISNSFDVATNGTMMLNLFKNNYWDKYDGYDLDKNKVGDVPYYPVSIYSVIAEKIPVAMILYRSFLTDIMNQVEKVVPSMTPDKLKDNAPVMKQWKL